MSRVNLRNMEEEHTMAETPGDYWYYLKPNQQEAVGPISIDELKHLYITRRVAKNTLIWTEGMQNWEKIEHAVSLQKTEKVKLNLSTLASLKPGVTRPSASPPPLPDKS